MKVIQTTCVLCNATFEARTSYGLCPLCWSKDRLREFDRLESAKRYAARQALSTTLTLIEWLSILSDWSGRCAYCETPHYSVIEMVERAYGLVRNNVVPACRTCDIFANGSWEKADTRVREYVEHREEWAFILPLSEDMFDEEVAHS